LWRPQERETDRERAAFSLIAAKAIEKLNLRPDPIPTSREYFPVWRLDGKAQEDFVGPTDPPPEIPFGMGDEQEDALDPCSRAWLELVREHSRVFVATHHKNEMAEKTVYSLFGSIPNVWAESATICIRFARDEIKERLLRADSSPARQADSPFVGDKESSDHSKISAPTSGPIREFNRSMGTGDRRNSVTTGETWRGFAQEFDCVVKREEGLPKTRPAADRFLRAYCSYGREHPEFGTIVISGGLASRIASDFIEIATRAGIALACPVALRPVDFWIHRLCQDLIRIGNEELFAGTAEGGVIERLVESSASYCLRLATAAEEQAHRNAAALIRPGLLPADAKPPRGVNRWILTYLASDLLAELRVPRMKYEFPLAFTPEARASVMAARLSAERELKQNRGMAKEFSDAKQLLIEFILKIFIAFAEAGGKLAVHKQLAAHDLEAECFQFLARCVRGADLKDLVALTTAEGFDIPGDVMAKIAVADEWKRFQEILGQVAVAQSEPHVGGASEKQPPGQRSPKDIVDAAKRKARRSYEKFASHIGIGKDTLYAITKENRWVSDETYILVAGVCQCQPEHLHPRDIPRPERRR
jgi:hypothetical protein